VNINNFEENCVVFEALASWQRDRGELIATRPKF